LICGSVSTSGAPGEFFANSTSANDHTVIIKDQYLVQCT
jgi:hypothetical protein